MTALEEAILGVVDTPYLVVTRTEELCDPDGQNEGFTILVGRRDPGCESALIVTATVSADGNVAEVTVNAYTGGELAPPSVTEFGGTMLISHPI